MKRWLIFSAKTLNWSSIITSFIIGLFSSVSFQMVLSMDNGKILKYCTKSYCRTKKPVPTFRYREQIGSILEDENFKVGAEVGVQRGIFSSALLKRWKSARHFTLVDVWTQQENYFDGANYNNSAQLGFKAEALKRVENFSKMGVFIDVCHGFSLKCTRRYRKEFFDFIYVDARHDYNGVMEDLQAWWPLLKSGGIMAGHDYLTATEGPPWSNWSINSDGTVNFRSVKGAVDDFANKNGLQLTVSYREKNYNTWAVRK